MIKKITLKSIEDTKNLAIKMAEIVIKGDVLAINGEMGVGKSTFVAFFIKYLNKDITNVPSPTFSIVEIYETKNFEIWHMDMYRIEDEIEVLELGIDEALINAVCLIEWAERIPSYIPKNAILLDFKETKNAREVTITYQNNWNNRINKV